MLTYCQRLHTARSLYTPLPESCDMNAHSPKMENRRCHQQSRIPTKIHKSTRLGCSSIFSPIHTKSPIYTIFTLSQHAASPHHHKRQRTKPARPSHHKRRDTAVAKASPPQIKKEPKRTLCRTIPLNAPEYKPSQRHKDKREKRSKDERSCKVDKRENPTKIDTVAMTVLTGQFVLLLSTPSTS